MACCVGRRVQLQCNFGGEHFLKRDPTDTTMQGFPAILTDVLGLIWGSWGGVGFVTLQPHPNRYAWHGTEVLCCTDQIYVALMCLAEELKEI